jgi:hypothetical protein
LQDPPTELPQARGRVARDALATPPSKRPLARRIYPNLLDSDTPCHEPVPDTTWKTMVPSGAADSTSFEPTHRARQTLAWFANKGRLSCSLAKVCRIDCTRGAFHRRSLRFPEEWLPFPRQYPGEFVAAQRL